MNAQCSYTADFFQPYLGKYSVIGYNVKNLYDEVRVDQQVVKCHVYEAINLENVVKINIASSNEALGYCKQEGHSQCTFR